MRPDKGFLKDDDRATHPHQEMSKWFVMGNNAYLFARLIVCDAPVGGVKVRLETPLVTKTQFLIGYTDVILDYVTDQGKEEHILIELKSSLYDWGATLRQIQTYREYLPEITKTFLIYQSRFCGDVTDESWKEILQIDRFFVSQGVYPDEWNGILDLIDGAVLDTMFTRNYVPAGKREATCFGVEKHTLRDEIESYLFQFQVGYESASDQAAGIRVKCSDVIYQTVSSQHPKTIYELLTALLDHNPHPDEALYPGQFFEIPCVVEIEYQAKDWSYPEHWIKRVSFGNQTIEMPPSK